MQLFYYFMQTAKQSFNAFLQSKQQNSYISINEGIEDQRNSYFQHDGNITFCDILKNPLFTESFDGNEPIAMSIVMECISSTYETTQEMISVMNGFLSEKLHFNGNYSFFDKEIFVNISDVNDDISKNFKEVSFRAFDNDDIDTSFFVSNDLIEKLYIIEAVAERNIKILLEQEENETKLKSIFQ